MPSIVKATLVITLAISVACVIRYAFSRDYKIQDRILLVVSFSFSLIMFSGFSLAVKSDYVMPRVLMSLGLTLCLVFFMAHRLIGFKKYHIWHMLYLQPTQLIYPIHSTML